MGRQRWASTPRLENDKTRLSSKLIRKGGQRVFLPHCSFPFHIRVGKAGKHFLIGPGYSLWKCNLQNVTIGDNVSIGYRASIMTIPLGTNANPTIDIGDNSNIGDDLGMGRSKKNYDRQKLPNFLRCVSNRS